MVYFSDFINVLLNEPLNEPLAEPFEITSKPQKLSPAKLKELMLEYLSNKYEEKESIKILNNILSSFTDVSFFKYTTENTESIENTETYIFMFGRPLGGPSGKDFYELHFFNKNNTDIFINLGNIKQQSIKVFSYGFNIIYWYGLLRNKNILIQSHSSEDRTSFYNKIANKIITKHNLHYKTVTGENSLLLKYTKDNLKEMTLFSENYI